MSGRRRTGGNATSYDEELTPDTDPPLIEPPPPVTMLGRIFAHRRGSRTVVRAPLVPVEELPAPQVTGPGIPSSADLGPDAVVAAEVTGVPVGVDPDEVEPEADDAADVMAEPEPEVAPLVEPPAPEPEPPAPVEEEPAVPEGVATRFCPMCDDRVPIDADGLHCHLGHRLSPAHAPRTRRRWFFGG